MAHLGKIEVTQVKVFGKTHTGKRRESNQDAYLIINEKFYGLPNLFIIADGMGGHLAGEVASNYAIKAFQNYIRDNDYPGEDLLDYLIDATKYANLRVFKESSKDKNYLGMGTTFTVLTIQEGKGYMTHIGDSRIYIITDDEIKALTSDHSYVQEMLKLGRLTKEEAEEHPRKNILTRALGIQKDLEVDGYITELTPGNKLLMCTDGLNNMISDSVIKHTVLTNPLEQATDLLIDTANENGGIDNITLILLEYGR